MSKRSSQAAGVILAVGAYLWWALITPLYFKALKGVPVEELLIWRILSGLPLLVGLLLLRRTLIPCFKALRNKRTALMLLGSTILISSNWIVFVLAIVWDRLTEASLGYYINPLVTIALGFIFLGERIRALQWVAVGVAGVAVMYMAIAQGSFPWISIVLAGSFGLYGLLRKTMAVGSLEGLTVEMAITFPICIAVQVWMYSTSTSSLPDANAYVLIGLLLGGFVTIVPLLLFASGARRLQLSTMGLLQYIAPTGQLLLATLWFGEPFKQTQIIVFALIWFAVALYSIDAIRSKKVIVESLTE